MAMQYDEGSGFRPARRDAEPEWSFETSSKEIACFSIA
jgi:hypothetical protein